MHSTSGEGYSTTGNVDGKGVSRIFEQKKAFHNFHKNEEG